MKWTCKGCGGLRDLPPSHARIRGYCSRACRHRATQVTYTCEACGRERAVNQHQTAKRFCGDPCRLAWFSKAFAGERSPQWRGGAIENYGPSWDSARDEARRRDSYQCLHCGVRESNLPEQLSVAHIVPFRAFGLKRHELANALSNLRSLCRRCHLIFDHSNGARQRANVYLGEELTWEQTQERMEELLALEHRQLQI